MNSIKNQRRRQLLIGVLTIILMVGMVVPNVAIAESIIDGETTLGSLTINKKDSKGNPLPGVGFTLYKIMNIKPAQSAGQYTSYEPVYPYDSVLDGISPNSLGNYNASQIEGLVGQLLPISKGPEAIAAEIPMDPTDGNGQTTESDLTLGYYMVVETTVGSGVIAGAPFFVAIPSTDNYSSSPPAIGIDWIYDISVSPKNAVVPLEKKISSGGFLVDEITATYGKTVEFVLESTVPTYPAEYYAATGDIVYTLSDKMSPGLTYTEANRKVIIGPTQAALDTGFYTWTKNGNGFTITFAQSFLDHFEGQKVRIFYEATLNGSAVKGLDNKNTNAAILNYSNDPDNLTSTATLEDQTNVYTFGINIAKFTTISNSSIALTGAAFGLYYDAACEMPVCPILSGEDQYGKLVFPNVAEGTYYIKEVDSPKGYTLLSNPIKVQIIAATDNGALTGGFELKVDNTTITTTSGALTTHVNQGAGIANIAVENFEGFTLPATGGMGIIIFILIGLLGIIAVSVAMTRKKNKSNTTV